jgi:DNA-binding NtrC family response regulator
VAINASAIPNTLLESELFGYEKGAFTGADQRRPGCFELADKGTLFLDEVGEIPIELQAKFLRVLEEEKLRRLGGKVEVEVDVRVVCATNRDLREEIKAGRFREDLYFRLNVFQIQLPPLRERSEDVPSLVQHFLQKFNRESNKRLKGADPKALEIMQAYAWPGNIRELRNAIERAVLLAGNGPILREHFAVEKMTSTVSTLLGAPSPALRTPESGRHFTRDGRAPHGGNGFEDEETSLGDRLRQQVKEVERQHIMDALSRCGGNQTRAARELGISRRTLITRLEEYNIPRPLKDRREDG